MRPPRMPLPPPRPKKRVSGSPPAGAPADSTTILSESNGPLRAPLLASLSSNCTLLTAMASVNNKMLRESISVACLVELGMVDPYNDGRLYLYWWSYVNSWVGCQEIPNSAPHWLSLDGACIRSPGYLPVAVSHHIQGFFSFYSSKFHLIGSLEK